MKIGLKISNLLALLVLAALGFNLPIVFAESPTTLPPLVVPRGKAETSDSFNATVNQSSGTSGASGQALKADPAVSKLEELLNAPVTASSLPRGPLVVPPVYLAYLDKVTKMSDGLLALQERFNKQMESMPAKQDTPPQLVLSLQELGAMTQKLSSDNHRFKASFENGESNYLSYKLVEQAVSSLEDAITYWRLSNRYRYLYRAEAREKMEDDEHLTLKLQTALNAIESLKAIQTMRDRLKKLDDNTYP